MKTIAKVFLCLLTMAASGCYSIYDPNDDLVEPLGQVAYVRSFTASKTTVARGETIELTLRSYAVGVEQKEVKIYEALNGGAKAVKETVPFSGQFSEEERLWIQAIPYTAPATAGKVQLRVEVITDNGYPSKDQRTINLTVK